MAFYFDNAISWALFRLRGGWKSIFVVGGWYCILLLLLIMLPYEFTDGPNNKMYSLEVDSMLLMAAQVVILVIFGGAGIANVIRRDLTNGLINSHRLMPLPPAQAVAGYIAGGVVQMVSLWAINLFAGAALYIVRGVPVGSWLIFNGVVLGFSISYWTAAAMSAFVSRPAMGWIVGLFFSGVVSHGLVFSIAPGLLAFCSPVQGQTIFVNSSLSGLTNGMIVGTVAQFLMAVLWIRGAARKYANANALSFTLGPSLATLGIWAGLSWFGIFDFSELRPRLFSNGDIDWRLLVVGAIASCLLVALIPLAALVWSELWRLQRRIDGYRAPRRAWMAPFCILVSLLFVLSPLTASVDSMLGSEQYQNSGQPTSWFQPRPRTRGQSARVAPVRVAPPVVKVKPPKSVQVPVIRGTSRPRLIVAVCGIFLLEAYLLMKIFFPLAPRAIALIVLLVSFSWFGPLFLDLVNNSIRGKGSMDKFTLYSPLGTMMQALDKPVAGTWGGVGAQGIGCLCVCVLFLMTVLRRRAYYRGIGVPAKL